MGSRYVHRTHMVVRRGVTHGKGHIAGVAPGVVTVGGLPACRDVVLMRRPEQTVLARTVSKADGSYRFDYLDLSLRFTVYAWDRHDVHNGVIADRIAPVLMPEFEP